MLSKTTQQKPDELKASMADIEDAISALHSVVEVLLDDSINDVDTRAAIFRKVPRELLAKHGFVAVRYLEGIERLDKEE